MIRSNSNTQKLCKIFKIKDLNGMKRDAWFQFQAKAIVLFARLQKFLVQVFQCSRICSLNIWTLKTFISRNNTYTSLTLSYNRRHTYRLKNNDSWLAKISPAVKYFNSGLPSNGWLDGKDDSYM